MLRRHGTESFKVERRIALILERATSEPLTQGSGGLRRLRSRNELPYQ
jgi:hypothetical protein